MYNSKTLGILQKFKHYKDEPITNDAVVITDFIAIDNNDRLKFKQKLADKTDDDVTKNVEKMVPVKYLSNFWRTLEMSLTNCEINLILTWTANCVIAP